MRRAVRAGFALIAGALLLVGVAAAQPKNDKEPPAPVREQIGEFRLEMSAAEVRRRLGDPTETGPDTHSPNAGRFHQVWTYHPLGLEFVMESEDQGGAKTIAAIRCRERCTRKTRRGIGVGHTRAAVKKAYAQFNKEASKVYDAYVTGDLMFYFERGKVTYIHFGFVEI